MCKVQKGHLAHCRDVCPSRSFLAVLASGQQGAPHPLGRHGRHRASLLSLGLSRWDEGQTAEAAASEAWMTSGSTVNPAVEGGRSWAKGRGTTLDLLWDIGKSHKQPPTRACLSVIKRMLVTSYPGMKPMPRDNTEVLPVCSFTQQTNIC